MLMALPAGAGKTKLVSTVVGSLRRDLGNGPQGEALAYFYCDRNQPDRQSHEQILKSFVRQLSTPRDSDMIPSCIDKRYSEKEKPGFASSGLTFQECCAFVAELVGMYSKVTLVLDALDECDRSTRHLLINQIDKLVSSSTSCVIKVFISSRPDKDIKYRFHGGPNVCISATDNGADIERFIVDSINNSPPDWRVEMDSVPGLREEIVTTLHEKADGMCDIAPFPMGLLFQILIECYRFQWAKLQIDQLLRLVFVSDVRDFLGKLPQDLKRAYDGIMEQIDSQDGRTPEIARRAFLWVMCSRRPLTPGMLVDAVCRDPETGIKYPTVININAVIEACRNLVMIDQSGVCRFSHLSVQEYLEIWRYGCGQAHLEVGLVCLQTLLDPGNLQRIGSLLFDRRSTWQDENILRYSVVYWPDHVRLHAAGRIDDRLPLVAKRFLGSPSEGSTAYAYWVPKFINHFHLSASVKYLYENFLALKGGCPAFAIIICRLNGILCGWWASNLDVNLQDDAGQSLLYIAGLNGNFTAATELLDLGCDTNAQGGKYGNALQAAAWEGSEAAVRLLLDRGADINAQGGQYGNALQAAAGNGNEVVASLLLDRGADINFQGGQYGNALQAAVEQGNEAVISLLLDRGADINAQGGRYGNALLAAVRSSSEGAVRLLLDRGADINDQGGRFGSALQAASREGNEAVVRLLLDRGADINALGGKYGHALRAAAWCGSEGVVRLLLDRGADINAQGGQYGNALQAAAWGGRLGGSGVVRLLLDRGADINAQGGEYGNALQAAAVSGNDVVVRLLLDRGADINTQGGQYGNALQAAAWGGGPGGSGVVCLLLDRGADVNAQGGEYGNALQAAAVSGNEVVVRLLLDRGADINAQGGKYDNALRAAVCCGSEGVVRLLLDWGPVSMPVANMAIHFRQPRGGRAGGERGCPYLVGRGADINAQGGNAP